MAWISCLKGPSVGHLIPSTWCFLGHGGTFKGRRLSHGVGIALMGVGTSAPSPLSFPDSHEVSSFPHYVHPAIAVGCAALPWAPSTPSQLELKSRNPSQKALYLFSNCFISSICYMKRKLAGLPSPHSQATWILWKFCCIFLWSVFNHSFNVMGSLA